MIRHLFKKNNEHEDLPIFWQNYAQSFEEKLPEKISEVRFIIFDTETTGFDFNEDRILSIGAVRIENQSIEISDNFEVFLDQTKFNPETVKIHGIIKNERFEKITEFEALKKFLNYIQNSVLVAHHAGFDIKMVNNALNRNNLPKLKNKVLDTAVLYRNTRIMTNFIDRDKVYSLDEIAEAYNIDLIDRHTASGDAYITALIFMKLIGRLKNPDYKLIRLLKINN
ncbi:3'-5' exonuclease [Christiangramia echinicola]|uniref:DNA polymerase-3 subunit epsilon n=1 Tax=Christiangramia echinicola TaxID=279359 RepID=A0A1H1QYB9_9FLAO|nr:3'-5' exonuclease [Christiangramia echinicola]SDS28531.1 DNA polymerase-3 subunit epsilon [Christiangramia echinicola]